MYPNVTPGYGYGWFGESNAPEPPQSPPPTTITTATEQIHWIDQPIRSSIGDPFRTGPPTRCTGYRSDPPVRPSPIEAGFVGSWRDENLPTWNELSPWFEHRERSPK